MSRARNRGASLIKDIYYTMYLLCCHLTMNEDEMETHSASILVSFVMIALGIIIFTWLGLLFDLPLFGRWAFAPLASIALVNYFIFVKRDRGNKFREEFSKYTGFKQILLSLTAGTVIVAIVVGAGVSMVMYRHAHGFPT